MNGLTREWSRRRPVRREAARLIHDRWTVSHQLSFLISAPDEYAGTDGQFSATTVAAAAHVAARPSCCVPCAGAPVVSIVHCARPVAVSSAMFGSSHHRAMIDCSCDLRLARSTDARRFTRPHVVAISGSHRVLSREVTVPAAICEENITFVPANAQRLGWTQTAAKEKAPQRLSPEGDQVERSARFLRATS
jgi:hypothetical protein